MKYTIRNKKTGKIQKKQVEMAISEVDQWKIDNPTLEIVIGAPLIHTGGGLGLKSMRTDDGFKSRIKEIKKNFPGNTLNRYGF